MNYLKIIETSGNYPNVLIHRNIGENGSEEVIIKAIGIIDEVENKLKLKTI